jgi:hypothetical protein
MSFAGRKSDTEYIFDVEVTTIEREFDRAYGERAAAVALLGHARAQRPCWRRRARRRP